MICTSVQLHFRLTNITLRGYNTCNDEEATIPCSREDYIKTMKCNQSQAEQNFHREKKTLKASFRLNMFCMLHIFQMVDTDRICLQRNRFGKDDVLCLDIVIYCVSVHAVTYCRPGNMSNGAMVYTAVCLYGLNLHFCNVSKSQ